MQTGDGLLVRLRLAGGDLSFERACAIASLSKRYGNGLIDLSARANLQLRGLSSTTLEDLTTALRELGLLDADADAEVIRNVIGSPLAGFDPSALVDIRPVMGALESLLSADTSLRHLPDKFGFLVDDGGSLPLASVDADVRFEASATPNGPRFLIRLAGAADCCLGDCAPDHVAVRALRLARAFLALCGGSEDAPRRMKQLVARVGVDIVARRAGLWVARHPPASLTNLDLSTVVGAHALGATHYVGAAAAFGRLHADQLERLASSATQAGAATLRLTPWRTILVVGLTHAAAVELASNLQHVGFIVSPEEPRLAVAACPGAPGCGSATTKVQEDALTIASLLRDRLRRGISVHVSGCAKGCAHPGAVHITLVGNAGQYDLVANGTARDRPVCTGLSVSDLPRVLAEHMSADPELQH